MEETEGKASSTVTSSAPPLSLHPHQRSHMKYSRLTKLSYTHNVVFATGLLKGCESRNSMKGRSHVH